MTHIPPSPGPDGGGVTTKSCRRGRSVISAPMHLHPLPLGEGKVRALQQADSLRLRPTPSSIRRPAADLARCHDKVVSKGAAFTSHARKQVAFLCAMAMRSMAMRFTPERSKSQTAPAHALPPSPPAAQLQTPIPPDFANRLATHPETPPADHGSGPGDFFLESWKSGGALDGRNLR